MFSHFIFSSILLITQTGEVESGFELLKQQLESYHFTVLIATPPHPQAYGLFDSSTRTIWINPIVFDLNIAQPTLIHEATHAAQFCAGQGELELLGLEIQPIMMARPFFQHYSDIHRQDLEREAFAVQTQADNLQLVVSLLQKYCQS